MGKRLHPCNVGFSYFFKKSFFLINFVNFQSSIMTRFGFILKEIILFVLFRATPVNGGKGSVILKFILFFTSVI